MITHTLPDMSKVPGGWLTDETVPLLGCKSASKTHEIAPNVFRADNFMNSWSVDAINNMMAQRQNKMAPVSIQGLMQNGVPENIGSWRTTMFNPAMAAELERLFNYADFPKDCHFDEFSPTDFWQGDKNRRHWKWVGVSPMLRYMTYLNGGKHFTHFDAGFVHPDDNYRTLFSFVLYLSTNNSGATRIIDDKQGHLPVWDRNHADWTREAQEDEVIVKSYPRTGSCLMFPHRVSHDVELFNPHRGEKRIIIRGDLLYRSV